MARTTNPSEPANTLPRPELNPLLNPVLGDNMGRWAEVYFTSPPEKREEAVLELLRELEQERSQAPVAPESPASYSRDTRFQAPIQTEDPQTNLTAPCRTCGHENPVTHQFCGMCGQRLEGDIARERERDLSYPEFATTPLANRQTESRTHDVAASPHQNLVTAPPRRNYERAGEALPMEHIRDSDQNYSASALDSSPRQPAFLDNDLSLFRSLSPRDANGEYEPPTSSPYRLYFAVILAIVLLGLGYMALRGARSAQTVREASPPPPPATESASPAAAPPAAANSKGAEPSAGSAESSAASKKVPESTATPPNVAAQTNEQRQPATAVRDGATARAPMQPEPAPTQPAERISAGNGAEELAMAQHFLEGTGGRGRDSSEAAKWLWKSIAKHNGQATLMLADLYLRGDGVSKNCDQGRVLLDSAARNGTPGAGERLRNLQAFGCH